MQTLWFGLVKVNNEELVALQDSSFYNNSALFAPCLENKALNDTFITEAPINLLRAGNYSHIPYIAGFTDREGTIRAAQAVNDDWLAAMQANFTNFVQVDLAFDSIENKTAVANDIKQNYFAARPVSMETIRDYLNYHGDTMITVSVIRGVRERALTSRAEVRLLEFTYRGTRNSDWIYHQIPNDGVWHGGVLNYVVPQWNATQQTMWSPVTTTILNYINYNGDSSTSLVNFGEAARANPHEAIMNYWNNLYSIYYKPPVSVFVSSADKKSIAHRPDNQATMKHTFRKQMACNLLVVWLPKLIDYEYEMS
ncbi:hypothetical protein MSG28_008868 [Choristoneura fumiferana]|uniref:Uncharacterized protein n=1 Tax=Choristoneura fumiferana TaxID=7141 RepID=A0ACC0J8C2_CHOFU|nr:hypothetical protein MSG28_008868 [Choristoneura fumiferana]